MNRIFYRKVGQPKLTCLLHPDCICADPARSHENKPRTPAFHRISGRPGARLVEPNPAGRVKHSGRRNTPAKCTARLIFLIGELATQRGLDLDVQLPAGADRKSTRLNSSHVKISYAVFCLKKKIKDTTVDRLA